MGLTFHQVWHPRQWYSVFVHGRRLATSQLYSDCSGNDFSKRGPTWTRSNSSYTIGTSNNNDYTHGPHHHHQFISGSQGGQATNGQVLIMYITFFHLLESTRVSLIPKLSGVTELVLNCSNCAAVLRILYGGSIYIGWLCCDYGVFIPWFCKIFYCIKIILWTRMFLALKV